MTWIDRETSLQNSCFSNILFFESTVNLFQLKVYLLEQRFYLKSIEKNRILCILNFNDFINETEEWRFWLLKYLRVPKFVLIVNIYVCDKSLDRFIEKLAKINDQGIQASVQTLKKKIRNFKSKTCKFSPNLNLDFLVISCFPLFSFLYISLYLLLLVIALVLRNSKVKRLKIG